MPPQLALLISTLFVLFMFRYDRKHAATVSKALIWPTLWYLVVASRPFGLWLYIFGIPLPGGGGDATDGSLVDRWFFLILTLIGCWILTRRQFDWGAAIRRNRWLTVFLIFMGISIIWSNFPFVSFKRYIKIFGSIIMALVILTEPNQREAFLTVIRRCLYIHLPMSIICVKYYRYLGVSYDWFGTSSMWQGISTSKNVLGQVAMLGVLYFFWEIRRRWKEVRWWRNPHLLYLGMAIYLLKGSEKAISLTSVSVCVFALVVFFGMQFFRARHNVVRRFAQAVFCATAGLIILVLIHSVVMFPADSFFGKMITTFGRDITLTDRTYIWHDMYAAAAGNPMLGVGFGGFWIGRLANIPWNATMTWVLGEGHNGYIDTYLQLGWVGGALLAGLLLSTMSKLLKSMEEDFDFDCFRVSLFLTLLLINITESTYIRGDHHLWLVMMIIILDVPKAAKEADQPEPELAEAEDHLEPAAPPITGNAGSK